MRTAATRQSSPVIQVPRFTDRHQAGRVLAKALSGYGGRIETLILALPRGVAVAYEVSKALRDPLDLWIQNPSHIAGKTVIVIDDGIATEATMRMAVESLRLAKASWIVVAAPVGSADACRTLEKYANEVICPFMPNPFIGVSMWYEEFEKTTDDEVIKLLHDGTWRTSMHVKNS
ncbi:MAG TPA: hypothetical protein VIF12_00060 [Micavibrio sp.]